MYIFFCTRHSQHKCYQSTTQLSRTLVTCDYKEEGTCKHAKIRLQSELCRNTATEPLLHCKKIHYFNQILCTFPSSCLYLHKDKKPGLMLRKEAYLRWCPRKKLGVSLAFAMKFPSIWFSNPLQFLGSDF